MKLRTTIFLFAISICAALFGRQLLNSSASMNSVSAILPNDKSEINSNVDNLIIDDHSIHRIIAVVDSSPPPPNYYLNVSPSSLMFAAVDVDEQSVSVTSNTTWSASSNATWIICSYSNIYGDGIISVGVTANTTGSQRSGTITFSGGTQIQTVSVTQEAAYLNVDPSSLNFTANNPDGQTVSVTSNTTWSATSNATWIDCSYSGINGNGIISVGVSSNTTGSQRSGSITFSGTGVPDKTISVNQDAAYLNVDPSSLSFTAIAGQQTVDISSNISWTVSSNAAWATVSPASGAGDGSLSVAVSENTTGSQRTATITVSGAGVADRTISVTQEAAYLYVNPSSLNFTVNAGQQTITVTSNISWTVSSNAAWATVSPASGAGDGSLSVAVVSNTTGSQRIATIIVSGVGVPDQTITVTQEAAYLYVDPASLNFTAASGQQTVTVTSNTSWTVSSNAAWVTVSPVSGAGNGLFIITVSENTSTSQRTATVTVSGIGVPDQTISVIQNGGVITFYIEVLPISLSFSAIGEQQTFTVSSNTSWTISSSASWLTFSSLSGLGNANITVTAKANPDTNQRTATITVQGSGGLKAITISVTQAASPSIVPVTGVKLDTASFTLIPIADINGDGIIDNNDRTFGNSLQLTATITPSNATNKNVTWSSSDTAIAKVSGSGFVTALSEGTATITATTEDGGYKATCAVNVQQQEVTVPDSTQTGADGKGAFALSLTIPTDVLFSGSFILTLPNGVHLDLSVTHLVGDLATQLTLNIVQNADGSWLFTIAPIGFRSAKDMVYSQIMQIGYIVDNTVAQGTYDAKINDLSFKFDNETIITANEMPVQITVGSLTGISDVTAKTDAYLYNGQLFVNSPVAEKVEVYSESGTLIYNFKKPAGSVSYPIESAKGSVLIIKGGSGWVKKAIR